MTGYGKRLSACVALTALFPFISDVRAAESEYETQFLRKNKNGVTPDVFLYHNAVTPGVKPVDLYLNGQYVDRFSIQFIESAEKREASPCITSTFLQQLGVRTSLYQGWRQSPGDDAAQTSDPATLTVEHCEDIAARIPASTMSYDGSQQTLSLQVPQEAVKRQAFSMIPSREWDNGVANLRTSYAGYFYQTTLDSADNKETKSGTNRSTWISLNSVGGVGPWRLYSSDSFSKGNESSWDTNHDSLYLSRDIAAARGQLSVGDIVSQTRSSIFGNIPLRGITLSTVERMMLGNQFDYSPVIRGIARTNARLVVRQQNQIIYSTTVTPGAFAIDDLSSARSGADLEVTLEEADGTQQVFRVPYSTLPAMIRPGAFRYSTAIGQYRESNHTREEPWLGVAGIEYGFEHFTLISTALVAENYRSISAGSAWNIGKWGAFSLELAGATYREAWNQQAKRQGSALRALYARYFESTNTNLQVAGYQYHSRDFMDISDYMNRVNRREVNGYDYGDEGWNRRRRSRAELNLSQGLGNYGNLYFSLSQERYYRTSDKNISIIGGAGTQIGPASVSITWTRTKDGPTKDNQINLSVSIPFSWGERQNDTSSLNYGLTRSRDNQYSQTLGYSGNALGNSLNYSANLQRDAGGGTSQSLSMGYGSSMGSLNGSIGHGDDMLQFSAGVNGGIVLYSGGGVLTPMLGDTIGIIETPDAKGIRVTGNNNASTDRWGRTVVSYMTPYRYNTLALDTSRTDGVELKESSRKVVPSQGAAVLLRFATRIGRRAMVDIRSVKPVPLGALVYVEGEKEEAGIVGNKGLVYLSGIAANSDQKMLVKWGNTETQQCSFMLPAATPAQQNPENWYQKIPVNCQ